MVKFSNYFQVAVVNRSTVITDVQGSQIVAALNVLLPTFCRDWSIIQFSAVYVPKAAVSVPTNVYYVYILDTSDVSGALGYHDLSSDVPYGKVFAKTILSYSGVILYEPTLKLPTVAQAVAHEVFELIIDPRCTVWWMNYNTGLLVAGEVADPVENNVVVVTLSNGVKVGMSDWILPSWQDVQNTTGPYNHLNTLTAPFQVKNGYAMEIKNSKIISVYGNTIKPNKKSHCQLGGRYSIRASNIPNMS